MISIWLVGEDHSGSPVKDPLGLIIPSMILRRDSTVLPLAVTVWNVSACFADLTSPLLYLLPSALVLLERDKEQLVSSVLTYFNPEMTALDRTDEGNIHGEARWCSG